MTNNAGGKIELFYIHGYVGIKGIEVKDHQGKQISSRPPELISIPYSDYFCLH